MINSIYVFLIISHIFQYYNPSLLSPNGAVMSPRIVDAGIAIECSGGAYIYISGDIGWIVSVVAVSGLGTSRGGGLVVSGPV